MNATNPGAAARGGDMEAVEQCLDLASEGLVWRILRRYATALGCAGSQLDRFGQPVGKASSSSLDKRGTVAQKLARAPLVESVLWLQEAAIWLKNEVPVWRRGSGPSFVDEPYQLQVALMKSAGDARWCEREANSRMHGKATHARFAAEMTLLCCEFAACMDEDRQFREWVEG